MKSFNQYIDEAAPRKSRTNLKWVVIMNYKDKKTGKRMTMDMPIQSKTEDEAFKKARQSIMMKGHKMISSMLKGHPTG
jgi:hypothetical protein